MIRAWTDGDENGDVFEKLLPGILQNPNLDVSYILDEVRDPTQSTHGKQWTV